MFLRNIVNHVYRYPKSNWKTIQRFGGYWSYQKMLREKAKMVAASQNLPPIVSFDNGFPVYFLTGKKHLYQTLFCAYSLNKITDEKFQYVLIDDGSFDSELIIEVKKKMPRVKLILKEDIEGNLRQKLPEDKFPYLNQKRKVYPHIKKLTDIHTNQSNTFKLVLDSDMLFWKEPTEMIEWLIKPSGALYMLDCIESYGFEIDFMQSLCGFEIPRLINVGVFGINSDIINWESLEHWAKTLEENEGSSYFLEQALSAMIIANEKKTILNNKRWIVSPNACDEEDILHHYVDLSKKYYFEEAWKKI